MGRSANHFMIRVPHRNGASVFCHVLDEVCGVDRDNTIHAVDAGHVLRWVKDRSRRKTWNTACGGRTYPLLAEATVEGGETPPGARSTVCWPPRVSSLRDVGAERCIECHEVTGRKRPQVTFRIAPNELNQGADDG